MTSIAELEVSIKELAKVSEESFMLIAKKFNELKSIVEKQQEALQALAFIVEQNNSNLYGSVK